MKKQFTVMLLVIIVLFSVLGFTGCSQRTSTTAEVAAKSNIKEDESSFPITIKHIKGETVIEKKPEKIVAGDFMVLDHLFALDMAPVASGHIKLAEGFPLLQSYLEENSDIITLSYKCERRIILQKLFNKGNLKLE